MPFVGCPINSLYASPSKVFRSVWDNFNSSGSNIGHAEWNTSAVSLETASKFGSGGPRVIISDGHPWAPTRAYTRSASIINYDTGFSRFLRKSDGQTLVGSGVWSPSGIWNPSQQHLLAVSSSDFVVDSWGVPTMSSSMKARIDTGLLQKAGDRKVNLGNALAEGKETVRMLAEAVKTLAAAYHAARHGSWGKVASLLRHPRLHLPSGRNLSQHWLEYIYGWRPLIQDIYDLYQTLKNGLNIKPQLLSVRRKISTSIDQTIDDPSGTFTHRYARTSATFYGKMWYRISSEDITIFNRLGLINPAEVAWEVIPFSFVVDWLIPVSSYLEALSARVGLTFVDGYYGCKIETISQLSEPQTPGFGFESMGGSSCKSERLTSGYQRTKMSSLPWPDVWFKSPFSTIHVANAIALLATLRRG